MSNLFNNPELTRQEKIKKSRKITNDLTTWAIKYMNDSGQFKMNRSNNIPSTRVEVKQEIIHAFDQLGHPIEIITNHVLHHFKSNQKQFAILDISGFTLPYNGSVGGIHVELEVKTGKDTLKPDQIERIQSIRSAGGISFVFSDKETFLMQIKQHMKAKPLAF